MENQYNYYNPEGQQGNAQYNSQPDHDSHIRKPKKKMPKAVVVTGCALLFGVVSSATFLTSNIVGSKVLGLNESSNTAAKNTAPVNSSSLTKHPVSSHQMYPVLWKALCLPLFQSPI